MFAREGRVDTSMKVFTAWVTQNLEVLKQLYNCQYDELNTLHGGGLSRRFIDLRACTNSCTVSSLGGIRPGAVQRIRATALRTECLLTVIWVRWCPDASFSSVGGYRGLTREVFAGRASDARRREVILMPPGPKYQCVRHLF
jgi:hypothetical protein